MVTSTVTCSGAVVGGGVASGVFFFFLSEIVVFALALPTADLAEVVVLAEAPAFASFPVLAVEAPGPDLGRVVFVEAPTAVVLAPAEPMGLFAAAPVVVAVGFFAAAVVPIGFFVAPAVVLVPAGFLA